MRTDILLQKLDSEKWKWKEEKKGVAEKLDMAYNLLVAEFAMWIGK